MGKIMNIDEYKESFPQNISFPEELCLLCDWVSINGYPISGCFRIRKHDKNAFISWFGCDIGESFVQFGASGDGGLYCLWKVGDHYPVIFLDSEGEQNRVLAESVNDFMQLLAIGYNELGYDDLSQPPIYKEESLINTKFQDWCKDTFQFNILENGNEIFNKAQRFKTDFKESIEKLCR